MQNLQSLGVAAKSVQLTLADKDGKPATRVTLFDQGVVQILQAAVTGLPPKQPFVLALSDNSNGSGHLEPLAGFMTNPAGAAIVNAVGPIRQVTQGDDVARRRYLVIAAGTPTEPAELVQIQRGDQNSNGRGRAVYRCGNDYGTQRWKRRSFELYPVLPCPGGGPGSARCLSACHGNGTISHEGTDPGPEVRRLRSQSDARYISGTDAFECAPPQVRSSSVLHHLRYGG
jgi:hypothetical protein